MTATTERVPRGRVLALGGLSAFGPLALDLYLPGLPQLTSDLRTSEAAGQLSLSMCMIGLALGQLLVGPYTDRVGRRGPLLAGVGVFVISAALCAISPSIELLLVLRLLTGLAGGAGVVIARAMVRDLYDGDALARVFALLMLVSGTAPVLAPVVGGQLLLVTDWRGVFWVLAGIGAVLFVAALSQPESLPVERRRAAGPRAMVRLAGVVLRDRTFLVPALVMSLAACALFSYIAMGSFVLQDGYGLDAQQFSIVFAANAIGIVLFGRLSSRLVGRFGPRRLLRVGVLLGLAAAIGLLAGVLLSRSVWAVLPPLFVLVGSLGLIFPNGTALALAEQKQAAGTASALIGLLQFALGAVVPPLASLGGVTALVMALSIVGTAVAAGLAQLGLRAPIAGPAPH
ncbi:MAG TPA: multidrug effflux MFS transporter [Pseudonocardia sp.]|nr:multidrug effflux MFS transporter [Pseudonocardia sp.]